MYRFLLHLFPASFRHQFATDMSADFDDGYADATRQGRLAIVSFMLRSYLDLAICLPAQWLRVDSVVVAGLTTAVALAIWVGALYVAAHEWPDGPATSRFAMQLGAILTAGCALSVLAQHLLRINGLYETAAPKVRPETRSNCDRIAGSVGRPAHNGSPVL